VHWLPNNYYLLLYATPGIIYLYSSDDTNEEEEEPFTPLRSWKVSQYGCRKLCYSSKTGYAYLSIGQEIYKFKPFQESQLEQTKMKQSTFYTVDVMFVTNIGNVHTLFTVAGEDIFFWDLEKEKIWRRVKKKTYPYSLGDKTVSVMKNKYLALPISKEYKFGFYDVEKEKFLEGEVQAKGTSVGWSDHSCLLSFAEAENGLFVWKFNETENKTNT